MCISNLHITRCFAYLRVKINRVIKAGMYQFNICSAVSSFFVREVMMTKRSKGTWNTVFKTTGSLSHLAYYTLIIYRHRGSRWVSPPVTRETGIRFPARETEIRSILIFISLKTLYGIHKKQIWNFLSAYENWNRNNPTSVIRRSKSNQLCIIVQILLEMIEGGIV